MVKVCHMTSVHKRYAGKAALILSCELSSLSQAVNGKQSDYVLVNVTLMRFSRSTVFS